MSNIKFSQLPNLAQGNITANTIIPVVQSATNYTVTTAELQTYVNSTTGNITASYFLGNGSQLSGINNNYGNANVATYLPTYTGNLSAGNISVTGNLAVGGITTDTGNITGGNIITAGQVSATANISTSNYFIGNGAFLTGVTSANGNYGNSNVVSLLSNFGSNVISTTGTITGNGSQLSGVVLLTGDQSISGNKSFGGLTTLNSYVETTANSVNTGSSFTPALANGPVQKVTASAAFTLAAPSGMTQGSSITLIINQDAVGNRVMTPNSVYKFSYGINTLSVAPLAIDTLTIFYDGTNYLCNIANGYI